MEGRKVLVAVFWLVLIAAPPAACAIALSVIPPGIEAIPMHWDASGQIDRYGRPEEVYLVGGAGAFCNLLLGLCYAFSDKLYDAGLIHGVGRKGARRVFTVLACVDTIIFIALTMGILLGAFA